MRGCILEVSFINQNEFNRIASINKSTKSEPRTDLPIYAQLKRKVHIPDAQMFSDIFLPQSGQIHSIWVPGSRSIGEAKRLYRERKYDPGFYLEVFQEAMERDRIVIGYDTLETRALAGGDTIALRDDFTLKRDGKKLFLIQFSIRSRNFRLYNLKPQVPQEEYWRERLLGIYEVPIN